MNLRFLLFLLLTFYPLLQGKAYNVSTEVQKKKALLEVFTGIWCGNCPDGDKVSENLTLVQPETVFVIDVHSGHYAIPKLGDPEYRTPEGNALDDYYMINDKFGYPCATVNRSDVSILGQPQGTIIGRSSWTKTAKEITKEDAPVNLWMSASFDGSDRTLTVDVEGYYTAQVEQSENFLQVAWTQDNIKGPQMGAGTGSDYNHRHMLKGYITPLWGDTISNPAQGQYFTRHYTFVVPENITEIPVAAENIEVFAFVTTTKENVLNIIKVRPSYINYTKPVKISVSTGKDGISARHAFNFFDLTVQNESHKTIDSIRFEVKINNELQTALWQGAIPSYQSKNIRLNIAPYTINESNTYEIKAVKANETAQSLTPISGSFSSPSEATSTIFVEIKTDVYADENIYTIKDMDDNVIKTFGPYPAGANKEYNDTLTLEENKIYCFEVIDLWGDGISGGNYKLRKNDGSLFAQNNAISTFGYKAFFITSLPNISAIEQINSSALKVSVDGAKNLYLQGGDKLEKAEIAIFSASGKTMLRKDLRLGISVASLPAGFYLLQINQGGATQTLKFIIH